MSLTNPIITRRAATRFIKLFGTGRETRKAAESVLRAMMNRSRPVQQTNRSNPHCRVVNDKVTGKRVFLVVKKDSTGDDRYALVSVLDQPSACKTFGLVYPKEVS